MVFELVRGYVQLASGLSEMTRARATEIARGLLSLPAAGVATGGQVAVQVGALAEELLAAAATNRQNLTALVRSEVDVAVTRLGLVSLETLEESQTEAARLRAEVAQLRSASSNASSTRRVGRPARATVGTSAKKAPGTTAAPRKMAATKTATKTTPAKTTATKTTATKTTAAKTTAAKTTVKKALAKKAPGTAAPRKAAATKTAAKTTPAKTTAAKTPAKKATAAKATAKKATEARATTQPTTTQPTTTQPTTAQPTTTQQATTQQTSTQQATAAKATSASGPTEATRPSPAGA
jgi:hypothetical protein